MDRNLEPLDIEAVSDRIRQDYARFPHQQSYELYAEDVFFQDPLNRFRGVARYQDMVGFIARWFQQPRLKLHELEIKSAQTFQTRWTLSWVAPLPWQPPITISGKTDYCLNETGKIASHIDYWDCSRLSVLGQVFGL